MWIMAKAQVEGVLIMLTANYGFVNLTLKYIIFFEIKANIILFF